MISINQRYRPQQLSEIIGQETAVALFEYALKYDRHPPAYLVYGPPGSGKTATVMCFLKALFCRQRKVGETHACGQCSSCLALKDPRQNQFANVYWVQTGKGAGDGHDSINSQINTALELAKTPPLGVDETHRHYRYIVIDELQELSRDQIVKCMCYPDMHQHLDTMRVRFIFSTMHLGRFQRTEIEALQGRCIEVSFKPPDYDTLQGIALAYFEAEQAEAPQEMAEMTAKHAYEMGGGYRQLLKWLEQSSMLGNSKRALALCLGRIPTECLDKFWQYASQAFPGPSFQLLKDYYSYLLEFSGSPQNLYRALYKDLLIRLASPQATEKHVLLLSALLKANTESGYDPDWLLYYCIGLPTLNL